MRQNGLNEKPTVHILWTGGWDSTFRIIQLSFKDVLIQPIYLQDPNRKSVQHELKAIKSITKELRKLQTTCGEIHDIKILNITDIEIDNSITDAYNFLYKKAFFGSQYDWLARFAKQFDSLELMIHQDDKAFSIINAFGSVKKINSIEKGVFYKIDSDTSSGELLKVFGHFDFPILAYKKLKMKEEMENLGFLDVMNKTWFCHSPINNKPCGQCNPCIYTIEEGLTYRFGKSAIKRYRRKKLLLRLEKSVIFIHLKNTWKLISKTDTTRSKTKGWYSFRA